MDENGIDGTMTFFEQRGNTTMTITSMKKAIATMAVMATTMLSTAGGLYIVSNVDFNTPTLVFRMNATQTEVPTTLFVADKPNIVIRTDEGVSFTNIQGVATTYKFNTTGIHTVKVYSPWAGVLLDFSNNPSLVQVPRHRNYNIGKYLQLAVLPLFKGCPNLTSAAIPDSLGGVKSEMFRYCSNLERVYIPTNGIALGIGNNAFQACSNLQSIALSPTTTTIGTYAFDDCVSLESIYIPDSVATIYDYAFRGCTSLKTIRLSPNLVKIYGGTFRGCSSLTTVEIPEGVTTIGASSLCASGIEYLDIPSTVTTIEDYAIHSCPNLTSITVPNTVTSLGSQVFYNCGNLTNAVIGTGVRNLKSSMFWQCYKLENVSLLGNVTNIGNKAFANCSKLTSLTLPDTVKTIGSNAFLQNGLNTLEARGFTVEQVESNRSTWGLRAQCVVTCSDGTTPQQ